MQLSILFQDFIPLCIINYSIVFISCSLSYNSKHEGVHAIPPLASIVINEQAITNPAPARLSNFRPHQLLHNFNILGEKVKSEPTKNREKENFFGVHQLTGRSNGPSGSFHTPGLIIVEPSVPLFTHKHDARASKRPGAKLRTVSIKTHKDDSHGHSGNRMFAGESPQIKQRHKTIAYSLRPAVVSAVPAASSKNQQDMEHDDDEGKEVSDEGKEKSREHVNLGKGLKHHSKEAKGKSEQREKSKQIHRGNRPLTLLCFT